MYADREEGSFVGLECPDNYWNSITTSPVLSSLVCKQTLPEVFQMTTTSFCSYSSHKLPSIITIMILCFNVFVSLATFCIKTVDSFRTKTASYIQVILKRHHYNVNSEVYFSVIKYALNHMTMNFPQQKIYRLT